ncbi:MAG: hypothetical protein MI784_13045 [Cytophagales bacterium]|nr:hypothetical protein [Cytophagales bacterium]
MKKFIFILGIAMAGIVNFSLAQDCEIDQYTKECQANLQDNYIYLKTFKIDELNPSKKKVQHTYVFSKGKQYSLNICSETSANQEGVVVNLYNSRRKLLGSNYSKGKYQDKIVYTCGATGLYYIVYTYNGDSKKLCGSSVLGMK